LGINSSERPPPSLCAAEAIYMQGRVDLGFWIADFGLKMLGNLRVVQSKIRNLKFQRQPGIFISHFLPASADAAQVVRIRVVRMNTLYRSSLALLTDLYEITMAYGYWKEKLFDREGAFHLTFRQSPFESGYAIACGLDYVIEYVRNLRFSEDDLQYLRTLKGNDDRPLFEDAFCDFLQELRFTIDLFAIPEGTAVFPNEPILRVTGPLLQCQLLESALLNMINFQTLIATKAARICQAAQGQPVIEFGLRRAQGIDGGIAAARAAYVGGCVGTSNVLAGKLFGIPVMGTHAHSWVMSFDSELAAFGAYAEAMPNNCVFLVDTYDSLEGTRHAAAIGKELAAKGHKLVGIRLDSGDLAYLSIEARKILDEAGFPEAAIVASNELDEHIITSLKDQGARINVWGVGTRLSTAYDQPALGGVYKLSALRDDSGAWRHKIKISEQTIKVSVPGVLQVRRYRTPEHFLADGIYDTLTGIGDAPTLVDPNDATRQKAVPPATPHEDLLVPIFKAGELVYAAPTIEQSRKRTQDQLAMLHPTIKRFLNPHEYPVGLEQGLHELRTKLILKARGVGSTS
jgi:nicotinate phosphoribosyltransferase